MQRTSIPLEPPIPPVRLRRVPSPSPRPGTPGYIKVGRHLGKAVTGFPGAMLAWAGNLTGYTQPTQPVDRRRAVILSVKRPVIPQKQPSSAKRRKTEERARRHEVVHDILQASDRPRMEADRARRQDTERTRRQYQERIRRQAEESVRLTIEEHYRRQTEERVKRQAAQAKELARRRAVRQAAQAEEIARISQAAQAAEQTRLAGIHRIAEAGRKAIHEDAEARARRDAEAQARQAATQAAEQTRKQEELARRHRLTEVGRRLIREGAEARARRNAEAAAASRDRRQAAERQAAAQAAARQAERQGVRHQGQLRREVATAPTLPGHIIPAPRLPPRLIASGTYGCAYRPRMKCVEPDRERTAVGLETRGKRLISKLCGNTPEHRACQDEFNELDKPELRQADPNNTYHIGGPILCTPDIGPNPENTILRPPNNCGPATGALRKDILIFEDGGRSLTAYRNSPDRNVSVIIRGFQNLFRGISIFNDRNFYHNDIKPDNLTVGVDPMNPQFRFIDFGISFTYPPTVDHLQLYDHNYAWWPLDSKILLPNYPQLNGNGGDRRAQMRAMILDWLNRIRYCPSLIEFYKNGGLDGTDYRNIPALANAMTAIMEPLYVGRRNRLQEIVTKIDVFGVAVSLLDSVETEIHRGTPLGVAIREFFITSQILNVDSNHRPDSRTFTRLYDNFVADLRRRQLI